MKQLYEYEGVKQRPPMITKKEVISIFRRYFPEPTWGVWFTNAGILSQFKTLGVKSVPIDGEVYGQAFHIAGLRPTKYEWQWVCDVESPWDNVFTPPDGDGSPGEEVTLTATRDVTWVWKEVPIEFEPFNLLDELSADDFEKMAKQYSDNLRANGIKW